MKLLVAGGSGFIGRHLIRCLIARGHAVEALARREDSAAAAAPEPGARMVCGDITRFETLPPERGGWDAVINAAGAMGKFGVTAAELRRTNVHGAVNLYTWAQRRGVKHFMHLSTVGVLGPETGRRGLPPVMREEAFPPHPSNEYERSKLEGEKLLLAEPGPPRLTIVRPGFTYGPEDLHKLALFKAIWRGHFFPVGSGGNYLQPVFIDDLIQGIVAAVEAAGDKTRIFNLCGERPIAWRDFLRAVYQALGKDMPAWHFPEPLARVAASINETMARYLPFVPPLITHARVDLLCQSYTFSIHKARTVLKYHPETNLDAGLARTVNWYRGRHLL